MWEEHVTDCGDLSMESGHAVEGLSKERAVPPEDGPGPPYEELATLDGPVREDLREGRRVPRRVVPDPPHPVEDRGAGDDPADLQHAKSVRLGHRRHRDPARADGDDARRRVGERELAEGLVHEQVRVVLRREVVELPQLAIRDASRGWVI